MMIANLRLTLSKPHWRYKFLWLVLSLAVAGGAYGLNSANVASFGLLSAFVAGVSMAWYALLVAAGAPAGYSGGVVNRQRADRAEKRRVWLFTLIGWPAVSAVSAFALGAPLVATGLVAAAVLAVFAVMRVTDISRESCPWASAHTGTGRLAGEEQSEPLLFHSDPVRYAGRADKIDLFGDE